MTASRFARNNDVTAIEPSDELFKNAWKNKGYRQLQGDVSALDDIDDATFNYVICHNVLGCIDDKAAVINALARVLKPGGTISVVNHNRTRRVTQMGVLLNDFNKAHSLLDGQNSSAAGFGEIRYYPDSYFERIAPCLQRTSCLGIRTFWDLQQDQNRHSDENRQNAMVRLETRVSDIEVFKNIAFSIT